MKQNRQKAKRLRKQELKILKKEQNGKQDSNIIPKFPSGHEGRVQKYKKIAATL